MDLQREETGGGSKEHTAFLSDRRWGKNLLAKKIGRKQKVWKLRMEQEQQLNAQKILSRINLLMGRKTRGGEQVDLVDCGSVMVGGEVGGAAGVTAGCRVVWRKLHAALVRDGVAAAETDLPPPPHPGEKGDSGSRRHLLSLSVPSSFSQLVCLSLLWLLPPPSAAGKNLK